MNNNFDIIYVADSIEEHRKLKNKISKINVKKSFDNIIDLYLNQFVLYVYNKTDSLNIQLLKKNYIFQKKKWNMNNFKLISSFSFDDSKIIIKDKSDNLPNKMIIKDKCESLRKLSFYTKKKNGIFLIKIYLIHIIKLININLI